MNERTNERMKLETKSLFSIDYIEYKLFALCCYVSLCDHKWRGAQASTLLLDMHLRVHYARMCYNMHIMEYQRSCKEGTRVQPHTLLWVSSAREERIAAMRIWSQLGLVKPGKS